MSAARTRTGSARALLQLAAGLALVAGAAVLGDAWARFGDRRAETMIVAARVALGGLLAAILAAAGAPVLGPRARAAIRMAVGAAVVGAALLLPLERAPAAVLGGVGAIDVIAGVILLLLAWPRGPYRIRTDVVTGGVLLVAGAIVAPVGPATSGLWLVAYALFAVAVLVLGRAALAVTTLPAARAATYAAALGALLAIAILAVPPIVPDPGPAQTFERGLRFVLGVASLALLAEAATRVVLAIREGLARAALTAPVVVSTATRRIQLGLGIALVALGVGVTVLSYNRAAASGGRFALMFGPVVVGIGLVFRALVGGFKTFVAWRYLLVFNRRTTPRAVVALVLGVAAIALAMIAAAIVQPEGGIASHPFVLPAIVFTVVVLGWGVLRHSKPSFVMYALGLVIAIAAVIAMDVVGPARPASPFEPETIQQVVLKVLNIVLLVGVTLAALAAYFGLLRSVFTFFTVIPIVGVWIGTSALVMVLAVMSGFETDLRDKILGSNAHIQVTRVQGEFTDWEGVKRKLDAIPGVVASTPYAVSEVVIAANNNGMNVIIKGIDPATVGQVTNLVANLRDSDSLRRLEPLVRDTGAPAPDPAPTPAPAAPDTLDPSPDDMPEMPDDEPGPAAVPDVPPPPPPDAGIPDAGLAVLDPVDRFGGDARRILALDADDDTDIIRADDLGGPTLSGRTMALHGILVGEELVKQTHLYTGEEVRIVSPISDPSNPDATGTPIPYNRDFRVAGVFYTGMYEYDLKYVYVTLDALQAFLDRGDAVDGIEVRIADADDTAQYVPSETRDGLIRAALGPEYRVQDWRELNRSLFSALKLEKIAMFLVLGIVILVASFSIVGNLIMVVVEKAREIALLKTLGAADLTVTLLFAIQGLIIGVIGTTLGIATGLLGCWAGKRFGLPLNPDVYYINQLPIHVDPESVIAAAAAGVVISIAATLYPALLASRVRPAAGMRH